MNRDNRGIGTCTQGTAVSIILCLTFIKVGCLQPCWNGVGYNPVFVAVAVFGPGLNVRFSASGYHLLGCAPVPFAAISRNEAGKGFFYTFFFW